MEVGPILERLQRVADGVVSTASLIVGLSIVATIPVVQLLVLGYLLVAAARVSEGRPLREALPGFALFGYVGATALGFWLLLWVPRLLGSLADDARLIDPSASTGRTLEWVAIALALVLLVHGVAALARGARLRYVLLPRPRAELEALRLLCSREGYRAVRDRVWDELATLELPELFATGLRGLATGALWLVVPITLLALGSRVPALALVGGLLLTAVVVYLPLLQVHVARERRLAAALEIGAVHRASARSPLATTLAVAFTLIFAVPLYALKIELIPREAMWLPGILFVAFMLPARLLAGWALRRAGTREEPRHWTVRVLGRALIVPVAMAYAMVVYFTQYLSWYGTWSLYEQHAFLLPVPFLGG